MMCRFARFALRHSGRMMTDVPCIECGNQDVAIVRPGFLAAAVKWFRYGRPWRPATWNCRECGSDFSFAVSSYSGRRQVPRELVRTVLHRRSTTPVPQLYATIGAAGIVTGLLVGRPWWLMGLAFLIATHLFFLATVRTDGLAEDLLGMINPRRRMKHRLHELRIAPRGF